MTHSATPVSAPKVTSGITRSAGSSNRYPTSETAQHEPTTHSAIKVEFGIPVIARPFSGAGWKEIAPTDASAPGRSHQPCGGCRGTPSPSTLAGCYADQRIGQGRPAFRGARGEPIIPVLTLPFSYRHGARLL